MAMKLNTWLDISDESFRTYVYKDGTELTINHPRELCITPSSMNGGGHSHRVKTTTQGVYVAPGWIAIKWTPKPGKPKFKF
jgi:hypothetical protein